MEITQSKIEFFSHRLRDLIRDNYTNYNTFDLLIDKDRQYASIAIDDIKKISYLTKRKIDQITSQNQDQINDMYGNGSGFNPVLRQKYGIMAKTGKFFKHLIPELQPQQVSDMVAKWYTIINVNVDTGFKFHKSSNIKKYYHGNIYNGSGGSLGNSCMKHDHCQKFLDFYSSYDVSILVLKNNDDTIKGRALIWHDVKFNHLNKKLDFMDRIYIHNDNNIELFKDYAIKNNMVYKQSQSYSDKQGFIYNDKNFCDIINIKSIDNSVYDYYPYVDTLSFMDNEYNISNSNSDNHYIDLDDTEGGNSELQNTTCSDCGGSYNSEDGGIYVEGYGSICDSCSDNYNYCDHCNEYYHCDNGYYVENYGNICDYCIEHAFFYCNDCEKYYHHDDNYNSSDLCQDCFDEKYIICDDCGENTLIDDSIKHNDYIYCDYCFDKKFIECSECNKIVDLDYENQDYCNDCYNEIKEDERKTA